MRNLLLGAAAGGLLESFNALTEVRILVAPGVACARNLRVHSQVL